MKIAFTVLCITAPIAMGATAPSAAVAADSWAERLSFKGDFRPRYDYIDQDESITTPAVDDFDRFRFRVRFGVTATVNDEVDVVFQLATGGDNPVSTNQTFGDGFSTKEIGVNLAYASWHPADGITVNMGKMNNPVHRAGGHHLVWDSDLNPEGIAAIYESGDFFGSLGAFNAESRSTADDSLLFTLQGGYRFTISETSSVTAGLGYFDYTNTQGNEPFWIGVPFGNSVDANGNLVNDYNEIQVFLEFETKVGGLPLGLFADFVRNTEADQFDTGFAVGARFGKASEPGDWEASIAYQDLEADAVLALFTDSDSGGGGTDATGFTLKGRYALQKNWAVAGALFINEVQENIGSPADFRRLQLDLEFKF